MDVLNTLERLLSLIQSKLAKNIEKALADYEKIITGISKEYDKIGKGTKVREFNEGPGTSSAVNAVYRKIFIYIQEIPTVVAKLSRDLAMADKENVAATIAVTNHALKAYNV